LGADNLACHLDHTAVFADCIEKHLHLLAFIEQGTGPQGQALPTDIEGFRLGVGIAEAYRSGAPQTVASMAAAILVERLGHGSIS
jgi:hypothetical protein